MRTEEDLLGVEFKLLKIQLIICSVSKSLMTSQMCESKSKLQESRRGFQKRYFSLGLSQEQRNVFSRREKGRC